MTNKITLQCGAIIHNDNEETLLLEQKQSKNVFQEWTVPQGEVQAGEKTEDALKRIVKEKLGIGIQILKVIGFIDEISEDEHIHHISFFAHVVSGEEKIADSEKYKELKWFKSEDIPENADINSVLLPLYILKHITVDDYNQRVDHIRAKK